MYSKLINRAPAQRCLLAQEAWHAFISFQIVWREVTKYVCVLCVCMCLSVCMFIIEVKLCEYLNC